MPLETPESCGGLGPSPTSPSTPPLGPVPWQMDGRTVTVSLPSWLGPVPFHSLPRYPPPPFVGLWSIGAGKEGHLQFPYPITGSRFSFLKPISVLGPCPAAVVGSLRPCFNQAHDVTSGPRRKLMMDIPSEGGPEWNRRCASVTSGRWPFCLSGLWTLDSTPRGGQHCTTGTSQVRCVPRTRPS